MGFKINLTSVVVDDVDKALAFYTEILGFVPKERMELGGGIWQTVVGAGEPDGTQLLLEPAGLPCSVVYRKALKEGGIPYTSFEVEDVDAQYERLLALGVTFTQKPMDAGPVKVATFDDTCGNLIQMTSPMKK